MRGGKERVIKEFSALLGKRSCFYSTYLRYFVGMWVTPFGLQCGFPERVALVKHNKANKSFSPDVCS